MITRTKHILDKIDRRLRHTRPGSVLIIVIVLLLLLAILGAAYISTTRSTRVASAQFVLATSTQLQLEGIDNAVTGVIANDLNDDWGNLRSNVLGATTTFHQTYRGLFSTSVARYNVGDVVSYQVLPSPPYAPSFFVCISPITLTSAPPTAPAFAPATAYWAPTTHVPVTSSLVQFWLADRIPTLGPEGGTPTWPNISQIAAPTVATATPTVASVYPTSVLGLPFESPSSSAPSPPQVVPGGTYINLQPTYMQVGGLNVPAFHINADPSTLYIAGDADGDGIADCLLSRVPGMADDGLTWYVGIRIIDNNSAINANTAWSRDSEFLIGSSAPIKNYYGLFQTGVGLQELITQADPAATGEFTNLNNYRFNIVPGTNTIPSATPYDETGITPSSSPPMLAKSRSDFNFITQTDELYHQLIRRLANPGSVSANSLAQSLSWSDSAWIASRFCLVNPSTIQSQNSPSLLELLLPLSTVQGAQAPATSPYFNSTFYGIHGDDTDIAQWYLDNFNFDGSTVSPGSGQTNAYGSTPVFPLRPYLTTRNPVSNYITPVYDTNPAASGEPLQVPESSLLPAAIAANCQMMLPWGNTPTYTHFKGAWSGPLSNPQGYNYDDIVKGSDGFTYIWIDSNPGNTGTAPSIYNLNNASPVFYSHWQLQPWNPNPTKANINTATFRELFRDFWCVMAGNDPSGENTSPYGRTLVDYSIYETDPRPPSQSGGLGHNQQCMFRSPLRDCTSNVDTPSVNQLDPVEPDPNAPSDVNKDLVSGVNTMQLRAALAAVNVLGLRNGSQDVISRTIILNKASISAGPSKPIVQQPVQVRVYSSAPQPVISEVYVNTYTASTDNNDPNYNGSSNPKGYIAIELYNPYGVPLTLNNWQVGYIPRTAATYPNLAFQATATKPDLAIGPMIPMYSDASPANPLSIIIPAHGYALLENYHQGSVPMSDSLKAKLRPILTRLGQITPLDAHYRPATAFSLTNRNNRWRGPGISDDTPDNTPGTTVDVWVPGLSNVIADIVPDPSGDISVGGEFVLLRPRRADGTFTQSPPAIKPPSAANPLSEYFNEGTSDNPDNPNLADLIPVDSYDFTGLQQTGPGSATYNVWSYMRPKGQASDSNPSQIFRTTYPGPYTTVSTSNPAFPAREVWTDPEDALPTTRPEDVQSVTWKKYPPAGTGASANNGASPLFGAYFNGLVGTAGMYNTSAFPPIQIFNLPVDPNAAHQMHFPNAVRQLSYVPQPQQFPFGTFARNGDMLEVPYIGAYRISILSQTYVSSPAAQTTFLELNSLPIDSAMAAIDDPKDAMAPYENIGRFVPLNNNLTYAATGGPDYFSWTRNLFNYFTVQSTNDNYLPNVDPGLLDIATNTANQITNFASVYPPATPSSSSDPITPPNVTQTHNRDAAATDELNQDNVGVDGLVNINTASYQILSQLPMVSPSNSSNPLANQKLAKAIINWRNLHGPFMSPFDLNAVIDTTPNGFQNEEGTIVPLSNVSSQQGILTPPDPKFPDVTTGTPVTTGIAEDFQADNVALTHISNMITTRSDTFTVYIVLQGWANAGTPNATPVITRRSAFIADRSAISADPSSRSVKTIAVPTE